VLPLPTPKSSMPHDDLILVEDMLVEARDAVDFTRGLDHDVFMEDRLRRKAVAHCIQTIGEAADHLSAEFVAAHPEVPWAQIVGMRHRIVHGYRGVSYEMVWAVVQRELPVLEATLVPLLEEQG
jgi:uncharacterized protein with HEPN domain